MKQREMFVFGFGQADAVFSPVFKQVYIRGSLLREAHVNLTEQRAGGLFLGVTNLFNVTSVFFPVFQQHGQFE